MTKAKEIPFKISEAKKKEGRYCCAYNCTEKPNKKLGGLCFKHYQRKRRKIDPVGVRYSQMKQKAKSRNIPFTIRIKWFRDWCQRTGYLVVKGRRGMNATVDRMCNAQGYHEWNIGLLTHAQNARKGDRGTNGNKFEKPVDQFEDVPF